MSEQIDYERRRFFEATALYVAASQLGMSGRTIARPGTAKPKQLPAIKPETNTSFGLLKQINAGPLSIG